MDDYVSQVTWLSTITQVPKSISLEAGDTCF